MSKRFVIVSIIILLVLNLGVAYFILRKSKTSADTITTSASTAANEATTSKSSFFDFLKGSIPKEDVAGEDPLNIVRYRGAIRTKYTKDNTDKVVVEYKVAASKSVVLSYYRTNLARNGWILEEASPDKIIFNKGNVLVTISAQTDEKGVTTFTISF